MHNQNMIYDDGTEHCSDMKIKGPYANQKEQRACGLHTISRKGQLYGQSVAARAWKTREWVVGTHFLLESENILEPDVVMVTKCHQDLQVKRANCHPYLVTLKKTKCTFPVGRALTLTRFSKS